MDIPSGSGLVVRIEKVQKYVALADEKYCKI